MQRRWQRREQIPYDTSILLQASSVQLVRNEWAHTSSLEDIFPFVGDRRALAHRTASTVASPVYCVVSLGFQVLQRRIQLLSVMLSSLEKVCFAP